MGNRGKESAAMRKLRVLLEGAPTSALKARRAELGKSQSEVAREAEMSQTFYSDIENGRRDLTARTAARLEATLKMDASELETRHAMGGVKGLVEEEPEELTAARLTKLIEWLDGRLPDNPASGDLVDALLELLAERVKAYRAQRQVATKSAAGRPDRDGFGRRRTKPTTQGTR
jgi:transcriptional regulator with XRE-family HTH domain